MNDTALTELVITLRDKRLRLKRIADETLAAKKEANSKKVNDQIETQLGMFNKELEKVDKAIEKAIDRCNKIIALQLSVGFDIEHVQKLARILKGEE
jgi:DNA anti-recombination protein RmuC